MTTSSVKAPTDARNLGSHNSHVTSGDRARLLGHRPATVWLTGLSGSGKSTLAYALEKQLVNDGHLAYVLDGDNIRHGLSKDIGFSPEYRHENIRRIAEVAKLFNDAGVLVIAAFISPYHRDRAMAREIVGTERFLEVHLNANIAVCESRDPKGLYKKAREGLINDFTGVSAPYEVPENPELHIDSGNLSIAESVAHIMNRLAPYLHAAA
ncbi:MAG: adenylyl-sulfate kinase [Sulfuricella sp.]|nr:adenylyl-sulfate kinase [Sulfuricella sp.]